MGLLRAFLVVLGSTVVAHRLAARSGAADASPVPDYGTWLLEALSPTRFTQAAVGRTLIVAALAAVMAVVLGFVAAALRRNSRIGPALSWLEVPALAVAVPGLVAYPLIRLAVEQGWASTDPTVVGQTFGDGLRFAALWAVPVALVAAPAVAAVVTAGADDQPISIGPSHALTSSTPSSASRWRLGVPTTAVIVALALVEVLSGLQGMFGTVFDLLGADSPDLAAALELVLWAGVIVAVVSVAVETIGPAVERSNATPGPIRADTAAPTAMNRARVLAGLALLTAVVAAAVVGAVLFDPDDQGEALVGPSTDGRLLGSDDAGRDLLTSTLSALAAVGGLALVAALIATVLGFGLASMAERSGPGLRRIVVTVVDVAAWPLPPLVALAVVAVDRPDRLEAEPLVVAVLALALTPAATRLLGRSAFVRNRQTPITAAIAVLHLWALAIAGLVVVGLAGFGGGDPARDLGGAVSRAVQSYDASAWPFAVAAGAIAIGIAAVSAPGAALAGTVDRNRLATSWRSDELDQGLLGDTAIIDQPTTPDAPPVAEAAPEPAALHSVPPPQHQGVSTAEPARPEPVTAEPLTAGPVTGDPVTAEPVAAEPLTPEPVAAASPPMPPSTNLTSAPVEAVDADGAVAADEPGPDADDGGPLSVDDVDLDQIGSDTHGSEAHLAAIRSGEIDIEINLAVLASVTKTVELRPSALRRAGITRPPLPSHRMTPTTTWTKPALAPRPQAEEVELPVATDLPDPPQLPDPPELPDSSRTRGDDS
jgi:ABC-type dipeptide/oligopeptide/nickel transport system permease subunit